MCLAIPGKIIEQWEGAGGLPFGKVRFGSVAREVCLAYVPEARAGDYVIVHVGFAIQRLDQASAERTLAELGEAAAAALSNAADRAKASARTHAEDREVR